MLKPGCSDKPGLAAAKAEARKFSDDAKSVSPVGGQHRLVPLSPSLSRSRGGLGGMPLPFSARLQIGVSRMASSIRPPSGVPPKPSKVASYWVSLQWLQDIFHCHLRIITCPRSSWRSGRCDESIYIIGDPRLSPTGALVPIRKLFAICNALYRNLP